MFHIIKLVGVDFSYIMGQNGFCELPGVCTVIENIHLMEKSILSYSIVHLANINLVIYLSFHVDV